MGGGGIAGIVISVLVISAAVIAAFVWKMIRYVLSTSLHTEFANLLYLCRSRRSKDLTPVSTSADEVVYDDPEEGNVQKTAGKSQQTHDSAVPMDNVYANTPLTKSNSLGVPQQPSRLSQVYMLQLIADQLVQMNRLDWNA